MRLGIFGGTFDPFHIGHVFAIKYALDNAKLDKCLVVVAGDPWQKGNVIADAKTRYYWAKSVCEENFDEKVIVDDREIKRSGPSYTVDTLEELLKENPSDQLVLIVGYDIPEKMDTWKNIDRIRSISELFVVPRDVIQVSSTEIRDSLRRGESVKSLIPLIVENDIRQKGMYNVSNSSKE